MLKLPSINDNLFFFRLVSLEKIKGFLWFYWTDLIGLPFGDNLASKALKRRLERLSCLLELNHVQTNKNEFKKYKFNIAT
ncbi:unnamed protein product [Rhizophagus irregularis]|nr:unnamed protein product [Rhizophagus irregularis]